MLSDRDVQELLHYQPSHPVLSIYLNTDPVEGNADAYKLRLRTMLKDINTVEDVDAIQHYFEREDDWSGRSVAVFSCAEQDGGAFLEKGSPIPPSKTYSSGEHPPPFLWGVFSGRTKGFWREYERTFLQKGSLISPSAPSLTSEI